MSHWTVVDYGHPMTPLYNLHMTEHVYCVSLAIANKFLSRKSLETQDKNKRQN